MGICAWKLTVFAAAADYDDVGAGVDPVTWRREIFESRRRSMVQRVADVGQIV